MHLNKSNEVGRNIFRATTLATLYTLVAGLICLLIELIWAIAFNGVISPQVIIPIGLVLCGIIILFSLPFAIKSVKGNIVLMTINPLATRIIRGGQTDFNEYTSGLHILWPWEQIEEEMDIEKDIVVELKAVQISVDDDDLRLDGSFTLRPNIWLLSLYKANGKDHAERVKNVTAQTYNMVVGMIESILSLESADDVLRNRQAHATAVSNTIRTRIAGLCNRIGVICNDITIGNIDYSEDTAKARRVKKVQSEFDEAVAASESLRGMSESARMQHLRIISDQSEGKDFVVSGLEKLNLSLIPKELIEALKPKKG
jgi:regulator of protease activity HflC (stomatin/prohibitin superfamily)